MAAVTDAAIKMILHNKKSQMTVLYTGKAKLPFPQSSQIIVKSHLLYCNTFLRTVDTRTNCCSLTGFHSLSIIQDLFYPAVETQAQQTVPYL